MRIYVYIYIYIYIHTSVYIYIIVGLCKYVYIYVYIYMVHAHYTYYRIYAFMDSPYGFDAQHFATGMHQQPKGHSASLFLGPRLAPSPLRSGWEMFTDWWF